MKVEPSVQEKTESVVYVQFKLHLRNKKGRLMPTKSRSIKIVNATIESVEAALKAGIAAADQNGGTHADEKEARS